MTLAPWPQSEYVYFPMPFNHRILVVDDEPVLRKTSSAVLESQGYEVQTAGDGFEALLALRKSLPDVIISDLSMPNMSGFEFLSIVRRRFPQIAVIAISGEYTAAAPEGLIADHYFSKAHYAREDLFRRIGELLAGGSLRPNQSRPDRAPVWIPRNASGYFVVTCTDCLRSFSEPAEPSKKELRETKCTFCDSTVCFSPTPNRHCVTSGQPSIRRGRLPRKVPSIAPCPSFVQLCPRLVSRTSGSALPAEQRVMYSRVSWLPIGSELGT